MARNPPAAGASGGKAPMPATIFAPKYLSLYQRELMVLLNVLRNPLATHLFFLLVSQCDFTTGKQTTSYARLQSLCADPTPERGRKRPAATLKQVRNALDDLQKYKLIKRNLEHNQAQGVLQIFVKKRSAN